MYDSKMMIVMRRDLKMRKGKIAAQAGHACVEAVMMAIGKENQRKKDGASDSVLMNWFENGQAKVCVYVDSEEELLQISRKVEESGFIAAVITDAGLTEFNGVPTKTCLALEPLPVEEADKITGELPLY